ncbi:hypothetical protein E0485_08035 [Paenibacillus albiflavus]|uniref:Uncharacterized protein n=1 Tax=Paenibacillus albiflavus TaxID=2545760 RepID=A0A4R4EJA4_9BACL|nr:hypothetical protein [Paenibacillus albiflavus]TCZ78441.1 hypothetical protein E0485_08035 [Paenibacillus albiflavus]
MLIASMVAAAGRIVLPIAVVSEFPDQVRPFRGRNSATKANTIVSPERSVPPLPSLLLIMCAIRNEIARFVG